MASKIEYIFSLQDRISAKLQSVTATSERTQSALNGVREKTAAAASVMNDTGRSIASLKMKIDSLQAERGWIPSENLDAIRDYNDEIHRLTDEVNRLENATGGGRFKKWAKEAFESIPGAGLLKNPLVAGVSAAVFSGKQAMDFDEGMAKVNITAQLDESGLAELKGKIKKIAEDNKADIVLAPKGFEQINSQLNDVDLSLSILDASLKGAKAGFSDVDTVSAALAQTLSIVGKENTSAMEVLDTFFAAKRVGAGEFADFARYMPNLIAGASNLGVAYKEVAGTFAYMTGKGQSAERAATLMENAFSVLGRGDVRKNLSMAGVNVFDKEGKIRSIVSIFKDLKGVMGSLNDEQKSSLLEKFGLVDKEAKSAFAILTSDIDKLSDTMADVDKSSGETNKTLDYSKNSVQRLTEVWNRFKNLGLSIGNNILPVVSSGISVANVALSAMAWIIESAISLFTGWWSLLKEGNPLIVGLTAATAALTLALGINYAATQGAVIMAGIKKAIDIAQIGVTWGLAAAQTALNAAFLASPLGWIVLAIGAVTAAVTYCWQKFEGFRVVVMGVWSVIKEFGKTLIQSVVTPFKQVLEGIGKVCSAMVDLVKGNFSEAAKTAKEGFKQIGKGAMEAAPGRILATAVSDTHIKDAWEKGKQAGHESWNRSKQQADKLDKTQAATASAPDKVQQTGAAAGYDSLMQNLGKGKKDGKKGKNSKTLRLDDGPTNLNETSAYMAATRKMAPMTVSLNPTFNAKDKSSDLSAHAGLPASAKVDDGRQNYTQESEKDCLTDIRQNVRKIAAAVMFPLALSLPSAANENHAVDLSVNMPDIAVPSVNVPQLDVPSVAVNSPAVNVPDIAVPSVNVPQLDVPSVAVNSPAVNVPDIAVPSVNVPQLDVPSVAVNNPAVNVPDIAVPSVNVPQLDVPSVAVNNPAVNVPDIAVPSVNVPQLDVPSVAVNNPAVNVPDIAVPSVNVPQLDVPSVAVNSPAVNVPDIAVPSVNVPQLDTPSVAVNVPEFPSVESSDAYNIQNVSETSNDFSTSNTLTRNMNSRSINVSKICDEVVIHVQNTEGKDADTIRAEILRILDQIAEV